jgi:hypothetical protein
VDTVLGVVIALGLVGALVVQVTVLLRLPAERAGERGRGRRRLLLQALAVAGVLIAAGLLSWLL